jgi:hypothetical protein
MGNDACQTRARMLADIAVDDEIQVREICFDVIRTHCSRAGVRQGDVLRCVGGTDRELALQTRAGARVLVDRFYACFVEVGRPALTESASNGTGRKPVAGIEAIRRS